jgi:hypothetical protein
MAWSPRKPMSGLVSISRDLMSLAITYLIMVSLHVVVLISYCTWLLWYHYQPHQHIINAFFGLFKLNSYVFISICGSTQARNRPSISTDNKQVLLMVLGRSHVTYITCCRPQLRLIIMQSIASLHILTYFDSGNFEFSGLRVHIRI